MGGLRKYMPFTHLTFLVACLAISGIPPFSGFFSKDEILTAVFDVQPEFRYPDEFYCRSDSLLHVPALLQYLLGHSVTVRTNTPHEAPRSMTIPLDDPCRDHTFCRFHPVRAFCEQRRDWFTIIHLDWSVAIPSIIIALIAIGIATFFYKGSKCYIPDRLQHMYAAFL